MIAFSLYMSRLHVLEHVCLVMGGVGADQAGPRAIVKLPNLRPDSRLARVI